MVIQASLNIKEMPLQLQGEGLSDTQNIENKIGSTPILVDRVRTMG